MSETCLPQVERVCAGGMKMAVLRGVDPNTANYVVAGWMAVKGGAPQSDTASVLMRLEAQRPSPPPLLPRRRPRGPSSPGRRLRRVGGRFGRAVRVCRVAPFPLS